MKRAKTWARANKASPAHQSRCWTSLSWLPSLVRWQQSRFQSKWLPAVSLVDGSPPFCSPSLCAGDARGKRGRKGAIAGGISLLIFTAVHSFSVPRPDTRTAKARGGAGVVQLTTGWFAGTARYETRTREEHAPAVQETLFSEL